MYSVTWTYMEAIVIGETLLCKFMEEKRMQIMFLMKRSLVTNKYST